MNLLSLHTLVLVYSVGLGSPGGHSAPATLSCTPASPPDSGATIAECVLANDLDVPLVLLSDRGTLEGPLPGQYYLPLMTGGDRYESVLRYVDEKEPFPYDGQFHMEVCLTLERLESATLIPAKGRVGITVRAAGASWLHQQIWRMQFNVSLSTKPLVLRALERLSSESNEVDALLSRWAPKPPRGQVVFDLTQSGPSQVCDDVEFHLGRSFRNVGSEPFIYNSSTRTRP